MAWFPFSTKEKPKIALKREMLSDHSDMLQISSIPVDGKTRTFNWITTTIPLPKIKRSNSSAKLKTILQWDIS